MENQKINFIGKGKQNGNKIQITFEWDTLKKLPKYEYEGKKYLTVDLLPLKETGKYGHTHTVVEHIHIEKDQN